jgi:hypothetical protein
MRISRPPRPRNKNVPATIAFLELYVKKIMSVASKTNRGAEGCGRLSAGRKIAACVLRKHPMRRESPTYIDDSILDHVCTNIRVSDSRSK